MTGGPARFTRNSTSPALLGDTLTSGATTSTGLSPTPVRLPRRFDFTTPFITGQDNGSHPKKTPQPRACNTCRLEHTHGLASSAIARHYTRNHNCFLFLRVLRCFTSPRSLPHPYTFRAGSPDMTPAIQGYPIRKPPDHSSFTNSPGNIADYHVLHRLLVPRHPPTALSSLQNTHTKIYKDAHIHYAVLNHHTKHPPPPPTSDDSHDARNPPGPHA